jgi:hypothetical protein
VPPLTLAGLTVSDDSDTEAGGAESGFTVSCADRVTPPPVTEIVTIVCAVTCVVNTLNAAAVVPAGIVTLLFTRAIDGWSLVNCNVVSVDCAAESVTRPLELPPVPTTADGVSVTDAGAGCGVSVTRP